MIDLERALNALRDREVEFVLIGGAAMVAQGSAQVTQDLDICYERSRENIRRLVKALAPYRPRLRGAPAACRNNRLLRGMLPGETRETPEPVVLDEIRNQQDQAQRHQQTSQEIRGTVVICHGTASRRTQGPSKRM